MIDQLSRFLFQLLFNEKEREFKAHETFAIFAAGLTTCHILFQQKVAFQCFSSGSLYAKNIKRLETLMRTICPNLLISDQVFSRIKSSIEKKTLKKLKQKQV